ncbi:MAG: M20/M25/M40 family metallo-hydrolase, partial [Candidatus Kerfeldbacteria bacterium]|nr:M20/M25/M40 family metallo-hydrolase [Candidatus Kerfeldbacteria bacterium]
MNINERRVLQLFFRYVKISSPSHQEAELRTLLRSQLVRLKAKTKIDGVGNLIAYVAGQGKFATSAPLLLSAHMDTVKPCKRIRPVMRGDVIMTDGKSVLGADDKAGIVAIMETLQRLRETQVDHPPLEVIFSVGEETFSDGASQLDYSLLHAPYAVVVDGGNVGEIDYKSAYLADVHATINGKAAHSGIEPEKGINAIQIAATAISKMKLGRIDHETTANIGVIRGGSIRNAVPAQVKLHGEARSFSKRKIEDQLERMYKALQDACEQYGGLFD